MRTNEIRGPRKIIRIKRGLEDERHPGAWLGVSFLRIAYRSLNVGRRAPFLIRPKNLLRLLEPLYIPVGSDTLVKWEEPAPLDLKALEFSLPGALLARLFHRNPRWNHSWKWCVANLVSIQGAVEMYNMDRENCLSFLTEDSLRLLKEEGYLKGRMFCCNGGQYRSTGDFRDDGYPVCTVHGTAEEMRKFVFGYRIRKRIEVRISDRVWLWNSSIQPLLHVFLNLVLGILAILLDLWLLILTFRWSRVWKHRLISPGPGSWAAILDRFMMGFLFWTTSFCLLLIGSESVNLPTVVALAALSLLPVIRTGVPYRILEFQGILWLTALFLDWGFREF